MATRRRATETAGGLPEWRVSSAFTESVDYLTAPLTDRWKHRLKTRAQGIPSPRKPVVYQEGPEEGRQEFERKGSSLDHFIWAHLRTLNDKELSRLVGKSHQICWGGAGHVATRDQIKAVEKLLKQSGLCTTDWRTGTQLETAYSSRHSRFNSPSLPYRAGVFPFTAVSAGNNRGYSLSKPLGLVHVTAWRPVELTT